jgi:hypothetical protein
MNPEQAGPDRIPLGQRIMENWLLLLALGIAVIAVFYTGWGIWEITTMTPSPLP